jgi:hypothetical protein
MLFGLYGRATRNFLALLCLMEFVLFIDRVNLAAAAPVMQKGPRRWTSHRLTPAAPVR